MTPTIARDPASTAAKRALLSIAAAVGCVALSGCPRNTGVPEGQDPEKFSRAEYDVARDEWKNHRLRSAMDHAQRASRADEGHAEAHNFVAILYMAICQEEGDCRWPEAEAYARKSIASDATYLDAKKTLATILLQQKKWDDAIKVLDPLAKDILYKTPELAWYDLGAAYLGKGQPDQAIEALSRAIALKPGFCWVHWRLGLAYELKSDFGKAEDELVKATDLDVVQCRNNQEAYVARARVRARQHKCDLAKQDWELCVKIAPATPSGKECTQAILKGCV